MSEDSKETREVLKVIEALRPESRLELRSLKDSVNYCSDTCDDVTVLISDVKALRKDMQETLQLTKHLKNENEKLLQTN